ncbi:SWIRM-domain-containing protein [Hesseltinella vesiculosa]|uniref:SWIRM-domain-containing protein n=1 Tax=Hesseltinella vesiculosa TaxID=101127 RepID=A0A1X2GV74_9FUNG|nr:SWIRM-domain-containing protein [Hesseltinella vesiculosa]
MAEATPSNGMDNQQQHNSGTGDAAPSDTPNAPSLDVDTSMATTESSTPLPPSSPQPAFTSGDASSHTQSTASASAAGDSANANQVAREYLQTLAKPIDLPPQTAAWFDMAAIHEIERLSLPEFFTDRSRSKTPEIYKDYRDFMINTYRLHPQDYLALTACRRNLAGDVCAIMRVHSFLQQWGLINHQCESAAVPSPVGPPFTGHFRVTADTPRGLIPFKPNFKSLGAGDDPSRQAHPGQQPPFLQQQQQPGLVPKVEPMQTDVASQLDSAKQPAVKTEKIEDDDDSLKKARLFQGKGFAGEKTKTMSCFTCGVDCTQLYYHCLKSRNMDICPICYSQGRFPSTLYSADYLKVEADDPAHGRMQAVDSQGWTDQETLLLLEAIEQFDDDWNAIAEHVGTKTRDACLTRFLQMPIEDPYRTGQPASHTLDHRRMPFSQADNPVMSVISFLASAVDPQLASMAAKVAVEQQEKQGDKPLEQDDKGDNTGGTDNADDVNHKRKTDDAMDVDDEKAPTNGAKKPRTALQKAASVALGSAAAKAHALAGIEEKEISRLVHAVVENEIKKLDHKMSHFKDLEAVLDSELETISQQRHQLFLQRLAIKKTNAMLEQLVKEKDVDNVAALVDHGISPKELHDLLDTHLFKDHYRLVADHHHSDEALKPPVNDEANPSSLLSL